MPLGEISNWSRRIGVDICAPAPPVTSRPVYRNGEGSHEQLLAGIIRYSASVSGTEPRFIKPPDGWLNDGRWLDEPVTTNRNLQTQSRGDSAIDGMRSYLDEELR
jgi:hypothetical protein